MAQVEISEDELRNQINGVLKKHRYILPFELVRMTNQIMKIVKKFIASQSLQKPF